MKKLFADHPYAVASVIFLILLVIGFLHLSWRKDDFMFMLLLYFIVTLSIRLDDISRHLGPGREGSSEGDDNVLSTLQDIRATLRETNHRLKEIQKDAPRNPDA